METMQPIKILVVDDSVVIRRLLTAVLDQPDDVEVVGFSTNGKLALEKIEQLNPDIVSLDVMMPVMNGIECMIEIRKRFGDLPVVMFSSLTEEGAATTMQALDAGANDFVTKPGGTAGFADSVGKVSEQLLMRIRALGRARQNDNAERLMEPQIAAPKLVARVAPKAPAKPIHALVIGSSTGGPNALNEVFENLPKDINVPILITQHMPPMFTRLLAERLAARSGYKAKEAVDGEVVAPGEILVAPGDYHMRFARHGTEIKVVLDQGPQVHSCRPAVDVMLNSACDAWDGCLLSVILTGMGNDGSEGCVKIAKAGGQVIVQDEGTSVVWGMPGAVVAAGAADQVLPLKEIAGSVGRALKASPNSLSSGAA